MAEDDHLRRPTFVPNAKVLPSPTKKQQINIRPGSGMAVIGVFVEVVRGRFMPDQGLPWVWNNDPKATEITIESAFNEDTQLRNTRPAIFIDRDEQIRGRTVLGDFVGQQNTSSLRGFWALDTMPILIECVAAKKAESAIIGDVTSWFLGASSDLIQAAFGLHEMTPCTLGRTQPSERDKGEWITPITFSVQFSARWTNKPAAPLLQQIITRVEASGEDNATAFFEEIALPSFYKAKE